MNQYNLVMEDGVVISVEDTDSAGNPIDGILFLPRDAVEFHPDVWLTFGCHADGIEVEKENPTFSAAHQCLLSKNGKTLLKICRNSEISKLEHLEIIGSDAFNELAFNRDVFDFDIPDGVKELEYRAFAMGVREASIRIPKSVKTINALALMIHAENTVSITFEGDAALETGVFGTAEEAEEVTWEPYAAMPKSLYTKPEKFMVTCPRDSNVDRYCRRYGIRTETFSAD